MPTSARKKELTACPSRLALLAQGPAAFAGEILSRSSIACNSADGTP